MKLYFYILDRDREYNPETKTLGDYVFEIRVEECEVIEKPKTYRAVAQFPERLYIGYVKKRRYWKNFWFFNTVHCVGRT
ncbi:MAG: hypothetical protein KH160_02990 [Ruminococcus sp.]|nr:hypothetical protein [Ruminococcus sp.]